MRIKRDFLLDPYLVLYLPLHELDGSSFMSRDAYGHLCTVTGALWEYNGRTFDGVDDVIYTSSPSFVDDTQGTVEVWVKFTDFTQDHSVASACVDGAEDDEFLFMYYRPSDSYKIGVYQSLNAVTQMYAKTRANVITDTGWHHWVVTSDSSTLRAYLDGIEESLTFITGSNTGQWMATATDADTFSIGAIKRATPVLETKGIIGEVRVYSRALKASEIQHNYLATKWRYQ